MRARRAPSGAAHVFSVDFYRLYTQRRVAALPFISVFSASSTRGFMLCYRCSYSTYAVRMAYANARVEAAGCSDSPGSGPCARAVDMDGASLTATPPGRDTSRELPLCCRCHDSSTAARGFREFLAPIVLMLQVQSMSTERHRLEQPRLLAYMQRHQARVIKEGWSRNRVVVPRVNRGENGHWCGCVQSWMERQAGT